MSPESRQAIEQSGQLDSILLGRRILSNKCCHLQLSLQLRNLLRFAQALSKVSAFPKAQGESCNRR
jgi:hypothetical protein